MDINLINTLTMKNAESEVNKKIERDIQRRKYRAKTKMPDTLKIYKSIIYFYSNSKPEKKYPNSKAAVSGASEP